MSTSNHTTPEDRPEYTQGDIVEVFNPHTRAYQWIEVEEVLTVDNSQILVSRDVYFCACWVSTESLATPMWKDKA